MLNVKCYKLRKDKYCLGNLKTGNKIIAKQETSCVHQATACPSKWWRWSRCAMCSAGCGLQSLATNWPNYGPAVCKVSEEKINTSCTPRHVSRAGGHVSPAACHVSRWQRQYRETDSAELGQADIKYSGFCVSGDCLTINNNCEVAGRPGYRLQATC